MTNMALPSGYRQITTGIQFRGNYSSFGSSFIGYIDTGCNGLTNGPQSEETVNKVSYEVSCRRDEFGDTVMSVGSPYAMVNDTASSNLSRISPVLSLYNITSRRAYTSDVTTREVTSYTMTSSGQASKIRLRFVRNGITLTTIVENNNGEFIDPTKGELLSEVFAYRSGNYVYINYVPDVCFGINFNTDYNLLFNKPDNIDIYLEEESGTFIHSLLDVPYQPQVEGVSPESYLNASNLTIWLKKQGGGEGVYYMVNRRSYTTITQDGVQYKVYGIVEGGIVNPPTVGFFYSYMNDSYAGMIIGNVRTRYWYSITESGQTHHYVRSFETGSYFSSLLKYYCGEKYNRYWEEYHQYRPDHLWNATDSPGINYKLYSKYNSNSIIEQYIIFGNEKIIDLTNRSLDIVSQQSTSSKNIRVGSSPKISNSGITDAADKAATDYILEIKVWDENDTLISHIIPVRNENTSDIGFYDLVKNELATVVLGNNGEHLSAAEETAVLHSMPKIYIKIGNNLEEFNSAYIKNGDLIGLSSSDVMEVKQI